MQAVFHYVLAPWGFAAVTIVRFETVPASQRDLYQTTVTCSRLLHNFDPFLDDSENDY